MNTGYISSDFMEIRQHLAHYVSSSDTRKVQNYRSTAAGAKYDSGARKALKSQKREAEKVTANALHGVNKSNEDMLKRVQAAGRLAYATYLQYKSGKANELKGARGGSRNVQDPRPYVRNFENFVKEWNHYQKVTSRLGRLNVRQYEAEIGNANYEKLFSNDHTSSATSLMAGFDANQYGGMVDLYKRLKKVHTGHIHNDAKGSTAGMPSNIRR